MRSETAVQANSAEQATSTARTFTAEQAGGRDSLEQTAYFSVSVKAQIESCSHVQSRNEKLREISEGKPISKHASLEQGGCWSCSRTESPRHKQLGLRNTYLMERGPKLCGRSVPLEVVFVHTCI